MLLCYGLDTTFEETHIHICFISEQSFNTSVLRIVSAFLRAFYYEAGQESKDTLRVGR